MVNSQVENLAEDLVAAGGFIDLEKNVLGEILGLGGVAERPESQVEDRLLVFVHQLRESGGVALLDA